VKDVEIADTKFIPEEKDDLPKAAEAFGRFVKERKIDSEYAVYGQFLGTPGKGIDEIRLAVVDRQGKVVLSESRNRQQLSQTGEEKIDPMLACYQLVLRLQGPWKLADPNRSDAPEGKMAQLWAEKSGTPTKGESDAMQKRLAGLKKAIKTSSLAVYPVRISGKSDPQTAGKLAELLAKAGFSRVEAADADAKLSIHPNTNQMRMAWDLARGFRDFLRKNPPATDYVLLVEYGIGRSADGKTQVGGVQIVLCDRKGDWVLVLVKNSHHPDFQRIDPQSPDDCNRLVAEVIGQELR
jgi:hypothetical protein